MDNEKIRDLVNSAEGAVGTILLEEVAPTVTKEVAKEVLTGVALEAVTQGAGFAIPGVGNMILSYKQKRMERNVKKCIEEIVKRQDEINKRLNSLEESDRTYIQNNIFGLVMDYVPNVKQEEKITYIVNGFSNIAGGINMKEDAVLMYFDVLDQMNLLDLRTLKVYFTNKYIGVDYEDNILKIMKDNELDISQMKMIKEKLERLGLLESKNEEAMYENLQNIAKYVEDISKSKNKPKLKKMKRVTKSESYKITHFGREFMKFFLDLSQ